MRDAKRRIQIRELWTALFETVSLHLGARREERRPTRGSGTVSRFRGLMSGADHKRCRR